MTFSQSIDCLLKGLENARWGGEGNVVVLNMPPYPHPTTTTSSSPIEICPLLGLVVSSRSSYCLPLGHFVGRLIACVWSGDDCLQTIGCIELLNCLTDKPIGYRVFVPVCMQKKTVPTIFFVKFKSRLKKKYSPGIGLKMRMQWAENTVSTDIISTVAVYS